MNIVTYEEVVYGKKSDAHANKICFSVPPAGFLNSIALDRSSEELLFSFHLNPQRCK